MGWSSQCYSISAGINGWKYYKTAAFLNRTATVDGLTAGKQYDYSVIYEGNIVAQGTIKPAISPIQTLELYTTNFTTIEAGGNIPLAGAVLEWTNPYGTNQNVTLTTDASIALPIGKATYTVAAAPDNYDIPLLYCNQWIFLQSGRAFFQFNGPCYSYRSASCHDFRWSSLLSGYQYQQRRHYSNWWAKYQCKWLYQWHSLTWHKRRATPLCLVILCSTAKIMSKLFFNAYTVKNYF